MPGSETNWNDVGKKFEELGRTLHATFTSGGGDGGASGGTERVTSDMKDAGEKVKSAIDELAASIDRAVSSPEVRDATKDAATSLTAAVAATIRDLTDWLDSRPPPPKGGSTAAADDEPLPQDDVIPETDDTATSQ